MIIIGHVFLICFSVNFQLDYLLRLHIIIITFFIIFFVKFSVRFSWVISCCRICEKTAWQLCEKRGFIWRIWVWWWRLATSWPIGICVDKIWKIWILRGYLWLKRLKFSVIILWCDRGIFCNNIIMRGIYFMFKICWKIL